jgi:hypothetical protein
VWLEEDPGPWLGRAIIYKLDGLIYTDRHDPSPTVYFSCWVSYGWGDDGSPVQVKVQVSAVMQAFINSTSNYFVAITRAMPAFLDRQAFGTR